MRKKGSRNRGYFYRTGRGWYAKQDGKFVPLADEDGQRLKDKSAAAAVLKKAYARAILATPATPQSCTLLEVCQTYLAEAKRGNPKTYADRADTLYDFCAGFPAKYRKGSKPQASERIHRGYGSMPVNDLKPLHIEQWLNVHSTWNGGRRSRIQAVKRALNYAVKLGLIDRNPIRGLATPKIRARVTYITPEQEASMLEIANSAFTMAIKVLIRTGARPGCEFAALTANHIRGKDKMEWTFQPHESKTGKLRVIRITDPTIIEITQRQMKLYPSGPIFRNTQNDPWNRQSLGKSFTRVRDNLKTKGIQLDDDSCVYSFRHTYAKRTLQGYWTGKATNIETLARLMGNSPQICREHYLQWCEHYTDPLWDAC